ncbi:spherulin-2A [Bombyx mori]|uniref:Uncharacterized protein n=1 Tax=Bombyx mori TaxID=7091 RepID=A0A8R2DJC1_BOMMO|nr:spherulin-2A [Bombyx mori]
MFVKYLLCLILIIKSIESKISIDIDTGIDNPDITVTYAGVQVDLISEDDVTKFNIDDDNLKDAVRTYFGKSPSGVYLKSPTPWGDLYKKYKFEQVSRVLSVKSARLKSITKNPAIITTQDFENASNKTIKVNTGITHTVENTLTTTWTEAKAFSITQEIEYDINVMFTKVSGKTGFSYTSTWGKSEEVTESITIGASTGMEAELQPGQAITAVLSAYTGVLEVEVVYAMSLRGNVVVNFKRSHNGHHFWGPPIQKILTTAGITNEFTAMETISFGFNVDASLKVFDRETGKPL